MENKTTTTTPVMTGKQIVEAMRSSGARLVENRLNKSGRVRYALFVNGLTIRGLDERRVKTALMLASRLQSRATTGANYTRTEYRIARRACRS